MPSLEEAGEPAPSSSGEYEKELFELLARLNVNGMNPDLWMQAATLYVAMGKEDRASKAYQVSIKVTDPGKGDPPPLDQIRDLLWGDAVPAEGDGGPLGEAGDLDRPSGGDPVQEAALLATPVTLPKGEGTPPSFASEDEALDQLRRELSPHDTVTCPHCNTLLESEDKLCYGCGSEIGPADGTLEERVDLAQARLAEDENDPDALFALAAHLSVNGQHEEALETLVRLTAVDPRYPGLWWVKAKVFLDAGKPEAARASARMAQEIWSEAQTGRPA